MNGFPSISPAKFRYLTAIACLLTGLLALLLPFNAGAKEVRIERLFPALEFDQPTALIRNSDNGLYYVLEKAGRIHVFDDSTDVANTEVVLDLADERVDSSFEGGLLGLAFAPDFAQSREVYVSYTTSAKPELDDSLQLTSRISRFETDREGRNFLPESEVVIISLFQPHNNHNGGHIDFGPDGNLYIGFGDGGGYGDPDGNAQDTRTLLGAMLRIDVTARHRNINSDRAYGIPTDNPFADNPDCLSGSGCPEIFAWGLRNPWRWSFDQATGKLWVGDVGQNNREEINILEKGANYGWNCMEGDAPFRIEECPGDTVFTDPVAVYPHRQRNADRARGSVTGGFIYRGSNLPSLRDHYLFGDFVHGVLWAIEQPYGENPIVHEVADTSHYIVSFGASASGEPYYLDYATGGIYGLLPAN